MPFPLLRFALFHGKVIREDSRRQMQSFGRRAYGLGLERFGFRVGGCVMAVGHGGANIGTCAYMIYLPDYDVSIAVMVNRYGSGCESRIARDISWITALSLKPAAYCFDFLMSPQGFTAGLWLLAGLGASIYGVRKDRPVNLLVFGSVTLVAGWVAIDKWSPLNWALFPVGAVVGALGLALLIRHVIRRRKSRAAV